MEKSILLNSLFTAESRLDEISFMETWTFVRENKLDSYILLDNSFKCFIFEREFASFDGENLIISAALNPDAFSLAKQELERIGFLRPVCEEVSYFPVSDRVEGSDYVSNYQIKNSDHEVIKSIINMKLDVPVKAKALRKNEFLYEVEIQVADSDNSLIKTKKIGSTSVKCALLCLCLGWMSLAQAIEDKNPDDLNFTTDREDQMIRYKKIIDKHIQENGYFKQKVDLYQSQSDYERNQLNQVQKSANKGVTEILKKDYRFEEKLRNKLSDLEDTFFKSEESSTLGPLGGSSNASASSQESSSDLKVKNKVRVFQGKAQVEAQYADYVKMKVEANAFANDKVRANIQTRTVQLKELGMQVYGQVRYMSSDQTVISEIRSGLGNNVDLSIYNKKTKQKDKPSDENVIEMRYQLDF